MSAGSRSNRRAMSTTAKADCRPPRKGSSSSTDSDGKEEWPPELRFDARPEKLKRIGCSDNWKWSKTFKSKEVRIYGSNQKTVCFHPNWSNGTAGVRGTKPLNRGPNSVHYWEIKTSNRIFGTSMMFGICTRKSRLHADSFVNMIGEDEHSWGLSHKGLLWHGGIWQTFCKPFRENHKTIVGMLLDPAEGTLTFYKDAVCLGVAFTGLHKVTSRLYPMVSSTAAKTEMILGNAYRNFDSLQDRCRYAIVDRLRDPPSDLATFQIPPLIRRYIRDESDVESDPSDTEIENSDTTKKDLNFIYSNYGGFAKSCGISRALKRSLTDAGQPPPYLQL